MRISVWSSDVCSSDLVPTTSCMIIFAFSDDCQGIEVGKSLVEEDFLSTAEEIIRLSEQLRVPLILPSDAIVAPELSATAKAETVPINNISATMMGLDIGPATLQVFRDELANSGTIVWNGPMGVFEVDQFARGTSEVAKILAELTTEQKAVTIVGGGDSVSADKKVRSEERR